MKVFFKGFLKGFLILLPILIVFLYVPTPETNYIFQIFSALIGLAFIVYFIHKYKLKNYWIILGLIFGIIILPFLFGTVEKAKDQ